MLNIERYKEKLKKCKGVALDCQIYKLRKECKEAESGFCLSNPCSACRKDNIEWLLSEYKEPILDDEEREYLSAVIKPFRKDVEYIVKLPKFEWIQEAIYIHIGRSWRGNIELPTFKKGMMYKGMEINKRYTLEELGL